MSAGSAMAFMVAGAVSSIPAMAAVWSLVKKQVFLAYMGFGIGGAIGSFYSGYVWANAGPASTFVTAAGVAIAAAVLVISVIRPAYQRVLVPQD